MMMAFLGLIDLVETQVAMAFGASVHPFTRITPSTSTTVINKAGFDVSCPKNSVKTIVIIAPPKTSF
jgi:hypothetical protein